MNLEDILIGTEHSLPATLVPDLSEEHSTLSAIHYGIALGSNLGDRLVHLRQGLGQVLAHIEGAQLVAAAPVYETEPVGCPPGSLSFYNSVVEISSPLAPHAMHKVLQAVERSLGRPQERERNSPRPLDLDILYAGRLSLNDDTLIVPHPRLHARRFVLQPLADIRPGLILPGHDKSIAQLLAELEDDPHAVKPVAAGWTESPAVKEV